MMALTRIPALVLCMTAGLLVAGCEKQAADTSGEAVTGEVLPGSISDAMIDLDTSTATPPMAPVKQTDKVGPKSSASEAAPDVAEPAEPAEKAPVASAETE